MADETKLQEERIKAQEGLNKQFKALTTKLAETDESLGKTAANLRTNTINVESDLIGLTRRLNEDCENLSFNDNTFDLVFTNAVLHHVEDIGKAVLEAYRVAKTDGYIVFIEPNRYHPLQILHGIASKHERGTLKFSMSKIRALLNTHFSENQFLDQS